MKINNEHLESFAKVIIDDNASHKDMLIACEVLEKELGKYNANPYTGPVKTGVSFQELKECLKEMMETEGDLIIDIESNRDFVEMMKETLPVNSVSNDSFTIEMKTEKKMDKDDNEVTVQIVKSYKSIKTSHATRWDKDNYNRIVLPLVENVACNIDGYAPFTNGFVTFNLIDPSAIGELTRGVYLIAIDGCQTLVIPRVGTDIWESYLKPSKTFKKNELKKEDKLYIVLGSDSAVKGVSFRGYTKHYKLAKFEKSEAAKLMKKAFKECGLKMKGKEDIATVQEICKRFGTMFGGAVPMFKATKWAFVVDKDGNLASPKINNNAFQDGAGIGIIENVIEPMEQGINEVRRINKQCDVKLHVDALLHTTIQARPAWVKTNDHFRQIEEVKKYVSLCEKQGLSFKCFGCNNVLESQLVYTVNESKVGMSTELGYYYAVSVGKEKSISKVKGSTQAFQKAATEEHQDELTELLIETCSDNCYDMAISENPNKRVESALNKQAIDRAAEKFRKGLLVSDDDIKQDILDNGAAAKDLAINRAVKKAVEDHKVNVVNNLSVNIEGMTHTLQESYMNGDKEVIGFGEGFVGTYAIKIIDEFTRLDELKDKVKLNKIKIDSLPISPVTKMAIKKLANRVKNDSLRIEKLEKKVAKFAELYLIEKVGGYWRMFDFTIKYPSQGPDEFQVTSYLGSKELKDRCVGNEWIAEGMINSQNSLCYMPADAMHRAMLAGYDFDKDTKSSYVEKRWVRLFAKVAKSRVLKSVVIGKEAK